VKQFTDGCGEIAHPELADERKHHGVERIAHRMRKEGRRAAWEKHFRG
jgi:hypothetical protein